MYVLAISADVPYLSQSFQNAFHYAAERISPTSRAVLVLTARASSPTSFVQNPGLELRIKGPTGPVISVDT